MNAAIPERRPTTEEISGVIERVTFHNDDSGFCVLRVKRKGHREETTVVGSPAAGIGAHAGLKLRLLSDGRIKSAVESLHACSTPVLRRNSSTEERVSRPDSEGKLEDWGVSPLASRLRLRPSRPDLRSKMKRGLSLLGNRGRRKTRRKQRKCLGNSGSLLRAQISPQIGPIIMLWRMLNAAVTLCSGGGS